MAENNLKLDRYAGLIAIIISIGTFFLFFYQTKLIREQQYASVLPYLQVGYNFQYQDFELLASNDGIGPAFVTEIKINFKEKDYYLDPASFLEEVYIKTDTIKGTYYATLKKGRIIPAGESISMLGIKNSRETALKLKRIFGKETSITIKYASVYGEEWQTKGILDTPIKIK